MARLSVSILAGAALAAGAAAFAQSWPQFGGPNRDFKAATTGLATSWPAAGPRALWSRDLGEGYSGLAVEGGVLYTMYRPAKGVLGAAWDRITGAGGSPEVVAALDAATGKTVWEHAYDAPFPSGMSLEFGPGPHATPLVAGPLVFAAGSSGKLHALDKKTGKVAWTHDLWREHGGKVQDRGYSCSPLAYGNTVVLTVGGSGQALMAFDQKTGAVAWKNHSFDPGPSSPVLIAVDGQEQLVVFHADGVAGVDPRGGPLHWSHPHRTDWGLNIALPVWGPDNILFLSSAYSSGSRALHLSQAGGRTTVKELWSTNRLRVHFGTAVRVGDHVYGPSGDFGPAVLTALDVKTGQVAWQDRAGLARVNFALADGKLVMLDEEGVLALATATPRGVTVHARATVFSGRCWTAPAVVGRTVYVRDRVAIKAFDLG